MRLTKPDLQTNEQNWANKLFEKLGIWKLMHVVYILTVQSMFSNLRVALVAGAG